jgi:hypothetical protein
MSLDEAMDKAHAEFGYSGFQAIRSQVDNLYERKYRRVFLGAVRDVFVSPLYLAIVVLAAFITYKAYVWAHINNYRYLLEQNNAASASFIIMAALMVFRGIYFNGIHRRYHLSIASQVTFLTTPLWILWMPRDYVATNTGIIISASIAAIIVVIFSIAYIAEFKTLLVAQKDYEEFCDISQ